MLLPQSVIRIALDVRDVEKQLSFAIKQNDSVRRLIVTLTDKGKPYLIGIGCYAVFSATTSKNTVISNGCQIKNNEIIYDLSETDTAVVGRMDAEITLFGSNGEEITSPSFTINVYKSKISDYAPEVVATDDFSTLKNLIGETNSRIAKIDDILESDGKTIDDAVDQAIHDIDTHAEAVVDSLPDTYVEVANAVDNIQKEVLTRMSGTQIMDDTSAYIKNVPVTSLFSAKIKKIGGLTRRCNNLFNRNKVTANYYVRGDNGQLDSFNETCATDYIEVDSTKGHLYIPKQDKYQWGAFYNSDKDYVGDASASVFGNVIAIPANAKYLRYTVMNTNLDSFQINYGTAAKPYEVYFEGLRSAPVSEIAIVGANLFDKSKVHNSYYVGDHNGNLGSFARTCASDYIEIDSTKGSLYIPSQDNYQWGAFYDANKNYISGASVSVWGNVIPIPTNAKYIRYTVMNTNLDDFYIIYGNTALPCAPFVKTSFHIPAEIQAIEGYGQSNPDDEEEYNYIDLDLQRFVAYGRVVNGAWIAYDTVRLVPVSLKNFINVAGGTLTFVNEHGYGVPSEVEYYVNAVSGIMVSGTPALKVGDTIIEEARLKMILEAIKKSIIPVSKIGNATLLASAWKGTASPYSQVVNINGVTANSQVDLTPSADQLAVFHDKDLAFVTENDDGVVTVYAIGQKPTNDYTIQVTITEVYA